MILTADTALDQILATLPEFDPRFFVLDFAVPPDPEHLILAALLDHPELDVTSADALLRTALSRSPLPESVAGPALRARLTPLDRSLRAFSLTTVSVAELFSAMTAEDCSTLLASLFSVISPTRPWTLYEVRAAVAAVSTLWMAPDLFLHQLPVSGVVFSSDAIDFLLAQPYPWPDIATFSEISDAQFAALLAREADAPAPFTANRSLLRAVTSLERLCAGLAADPAISDLYGYVSFWNESIEALVHTSADVARIAPLLNRHYAIELIANGTPFARPCPLLSARVLTDLLARFDDITPRIIARYQSAPDWYAARLLLRVPGLASSLADSLDRPANIPLAGQFLSVLDRLTRLAAASPQAATSLLSSAATLNQALSAARIISDS